MNCAVFLNKIRLIPRIRNVYLEGVKTKELVQLSCLPYRTWLMAAHTGFSHHQQSHVSGRPGADWKLKTSTLEEDWKQ